MCSRDTQSVVTISALLDAVTFSKCWVIERRSEKNVTKRMLGLIDYARLMPDSVGGKETWRIMPPTRNAGFTLEMHAPCMQAACRTHEACCTLLHPAYRRTQAAYGRNTSEMQAAFGKIRPAF